MKHFPLIVFLIALLLLDESKGGEKLDH